MKAATQPAPTMVPASWLSVLDLAVREVFAIMLDCRPTSLNGTSEEFDLTAIVGLAGQLCGVLTLRCSQNAAAFVTSRMLGQELAAADTDQINEHLWDAVGEMCNMIAGNFKNKLPDLADTCMLSVPTVVVGRDYKLRARAGCETLEVRLAFENYAFAVALNVHS